MFTVPTILTMLTRDASVDRHDHASLRYVIYAGAPMYRADQVHALRKLGPVLVQYFGLGEVTGNITVLPPHWHSENDADLPVGTCGYARAAGHRDPRCGWRAASRQHHGRDLRARSPRVRRRLEQCRGDRESLCDGWFHTGDLGRPPARGFLFITGRVRHVYLRRVERYPREIEEALLTHAAIAEACVLGLPHPKWGEAGVAVLVARGPVEPDALLAHLAASVALQAACALRVLAGAAEIRLRQGAEEGRACATDRGGRRL